MAAPEKTQLEGIPTSLTELTSKELRRIQMEEWLSKNALPKKVKLPPPKKRKPGRFQKPGPMTDEQWAAFYKRYRKIISSRRRRMAKRMRSAQKQLPPPRIAPIGKLMKRIRKLQRPKMPREKFLPYIKPDVFRPGILSNPQPEMEKLRPFPDIDVPPSYKFVHEELKYLYWTFIRFPVFPYASKYNATERIKQLAKPKKMPYRKHCIIPTPPPEFILESRKMTYKRWLAHLRYLKYFAAPKPDRTRRYCMRRLKMPLDQLMPRIELLSEPKAPRAVKCDEQPYPAHSTVSKAAQSAEPSSRTTSLAKARHPVRKCEDRPMVKTGVKKGALKATASGRVTELATPKKDFSTLNVSKPKKHVRKIRPAKCLNYSLGQGPPDEE